MSSSDKTYAVHEELLRASSACFAAALGNNFVEGDEGKLRLPDTATEIFESFVDWLYTGKSPVRLGDSGAPNYYLRVYIFADKYAIPQLRRAIISDLTERLKPPPYRKVTHAYENLPADSGLIRLVVDVYLKKFYESTDDAEEILARNKLPKEFLIEMFVGFAKLVESGRDSDGGPRALYGNIKNPCEYHEHPDQKSKEACRYKKAPKIG